MSESPEPAARRHTAQPGWLARASIRIAPVMLLGCGDVAAMAPDARTIASDAASNPCAPGTCLLSDDFSGAGLDTAVWAFAVGGGATVTQHNGVLTLRIPAAVDAFADVYSLLGFPAGTSFEASATFTGGQFYDHKGMGFASARINSGCDTGETDAAMFRGQDGDSYLETRSGGAATCTLRQQAYPSGTSTLQITRTTDQVVFHNNGIGFDPIKTNVPEGLLPVRFSVYTFTTAPALPVQIDIDYVRVSRP